MKIAEFAAKAYEAAFERECLSRYPAVDAIEQEAGFALETERYLPAAKVLACPLKANPPNWQHGRVLYALTRQYLAQMTGPVHLLDIGTAKGYSALCLLWALTDSKVHGRVTSVDVIDPNGLELRNSIVECEGPKTLAQILAPWPEAQRIDFLQSTGTKWLTANAGRVHVAFVDGKHSYEAVSWEASLLAERQQAGDLVVFDDVQIAAVDRAVFELRSYTVRYVDVLPNRKYAIARRK
jgi:predicted O-methyltransferase YrrM